MLAITSFKLNYPKNMKTPLLTFLVVCFLVLGPAIVVEAVISDEFGGGKSEQSMPVGTSAGLTREENRNRNENAFDAADTMSSAAGEKEQARETERKHERAEEAWISVTGDTAEVISDEGLRVPLKISDENISLEGNKLLIGNSSGVMTECQTKTALPTFVNQLAKTWRQSEGSATLETFEIKIEDGQPVYEVSLSETSKLFGLIPIKLRRVVIISTETEEIVRVKQPWYAFMARKLNLSKP